MEVLIDRVSALIANGHEQKFEELAQKLERTPILHEDLEKKLNDIGADPIAEAQIFEKITDMIELAMHLLTKKEFSKYTTEEVGDFIFAVKTKISDFKDKDGIFKSTPNTEECRLPNFLEADEIMSAAKEQNNLRLSLVDAKDKEKVLKQIDKESKKSEERIFEISGLDIEKLTDWEKSLVVKQMYETALNGAMSAMGKRY